MSNASILAGFVTSISPVNNLNVGVVTASGFVGNLTGNATGLSGTPNVTVGVITATSYSGDGTGLTGVGIGTTGSVNTTGIGTFGTLVATVDLDIPNGTSDQRPVTPVTGSIRYNTTYNVLEFYDGIQWIGVFSSRTEEFARGVFGGGYTPTLQNTIDYITIATTGNATDFGDLSVARIGPGACSSSARGVFGGGATPTNTNTIDFITIATTGNATDFGDLTVARGYLAACSSSTRGVFGGGSTNTIDYITIATTGNATDFGDLTVSRYGLAACSSSTRGVFGGGFNLLPSPAGTRLNVIDYTTIATTGNATDFGDLTQARQGLAACSNGHGGLS